MANKKDLKSITTKGFLWNTLEKFSVKGMQFAIGIILARLLVPEDFGLIGMLVIFIALSNTFVESGMGIGLVQKKNRTSKDYSTVFVFNFLISSLFYVLLFFNAPLIANFYEQPSLEIITKVIGLNLIINSLAIVQRNRLTIKMDFKTLAKINVVATLISGCFSIYLAYHNFGVWTLVYRQLVGSIISVILLWYFSRWSPSLYFSKKSFKELFGFGSKLLVAGLYAQLFQNVYNVMIGKFYAISQLGFYTQSKQLTDITSGTISGIVQQVTFPLLASLQDDKTKMVSIFKRLIKMTAFIIFPTMTLLSVLADPFVRLALGEKWLEVIPLLQWMCFTRVFYPINALNMNLLNAIGRSDLFLKLDFSKAPILIIILIITLPISVKAMVIGQIVGSIVGFFINTYYSSKLFGYGCFSQLRDVGSILLATGLMALFVIVGVWNVESFILKLLIGGCLGSVSYFIFCKLFGVKEIEEVNKIIKKVR